MTELKTLKDLENPYGEGYVDRRDLRQEAIKWIKEFRRLDDEANWYAGNQFKQFFNITEEELK